MNDVSIYAIAIVIFAVIWFYAYLTARSADWHLMKVEDIRWQRSSFWKGSSIVSIVLFSVCYRYVLGIPAHYIKFGFFNLGAELMMSQQAIAQSWILVRVALFVPAIIGGVMTTIAIARQCATVPSSEDMPEQPLK